MPSEGGGSNIGPRPAADNQRLYPLLLGFARLCWLPPLGTAGTMELKHEVPVAVSLGAASGLLEAEPCGTAAGTVVV